MSKRAADISQIRKYLNGELDAQTMHRLERQAQDDPFLMDALEGYEKAGNKQQANLEELTARLKKRVEQKQVRIIPWNIIGIAASVLIVCSAGIWLLTDKQQTKRREVAVVVKRVEKEKYAVPSIAPVTKTARVAPVEQVKFPPPVVAPDAKIASVPPQQNSRNISTAKIPTAADKMVTVQSIAEADQKVEERKQVPSVNEIANAVVKDSIKKDTTPLDEMIVTGYTTNKKKAVLKEVNIATEYKASKPKDTVAQQLLQGQVPGVANNNVNAPRLPVGAVPYGYTPHLSLKEISIINKNYDSSKRLINGRVVANDDGLPIPGVTIKIAGTNTTTQTDANGRFRLSVDSSKATLLVGYLGYETRRVSANNNDSVKNIALKPVNNTLAEVVVSEPYEKSDADTIAIDAHPKIGWGDFRKYLKKNSFSPDGKTGVVKLSFMVGKNGTVSDIKVQKGISQATNQKAVDLIHNGPGWAGNTNGSPEKVSLRVKFVK